MADDLQKVSPGDPLSIRASTFNTLIDSAKAWKSAQARTGAGPLAVDPLHPSCLVLVKNTTGATLPEWSVVTPTGVVIDPVDAPFETARTPVFTVSAPTASTDPVLVTLAPIEDGKLGRAAAAGVCVAQVHVTSTSHRYAVPSSGNLFQMESADAGPAYLLDPPGVSNQLTMILLGSPQPVVSGGGTTGFFARLTGESGGNWNFFKLKLSSGSYVDDGAQVTGYSAVPLKVDGTLYESDPVAGMRVWMIPSQQSGKYEFLPIGRQSWQWVVNNSTSMYIIADDTATGTGLALILPETGAFAFTATFSYFISMSGVATAYLSAWVRNTTAGVDSDTIWTSEPATTHLHYATVCFTFFINGTLGDSVELYGLRHRNSGTWANNPSFELANLKCLRVA